MPRILREQSLGVGGLWITGEKGNGCLELLGPELEGDWKLLSLLSSRDRCVRGLDSSAFRRQLGAGLRVSMEDGSWDPQVSGWSWAGIPRSVVRWRWGGHTPKWDGVTWGLGSLTCSLGSKITIGEQS